MKRFIVLTMVLALAVSIAAPVAAAKPSATVSAEQHCNLDSGLRVTVSLSGGKFLNKFVAIRYLIIESPSGEEAAWYLSAPTKGVAEISETFPLEDGDYYGNAVVYAARKDGTVTSRIIAGPLIFPLETVNCAT